jgi:prophage tail gpP-like protein
MLDLTAFLPAIPGGTTEIMYVLVNGQRYTAFMRAQVRAGFNEAARAFELTVAAEPNGAVTAAIFRAGTPVSVYATDTLLMQGFVDQYRPHLAAHDASIVVTGRSKSADLIDSDADHPTGFFQNKDPQQIGAELAQEYGATFKTDQTLTKLDQYLITPGETIFRAVEKMTRKQGMTLAGTAEGDINITAPKGQRHAGGLFEGRNILVGNADHNWSNRHSKYSIKGQRAVGHGARRLHMVAKTTDSAVSRHRHKTVIHDDDGTIDDLKKRVTNRRNRAAGNALKASISVQGFRDEGGKVWEPGFLVWTESQFLDIAQDMLIEAADYSQSEQGTITLLSLVDPRAYGSNGAGGGKGAKSGVEWREGTESAVDATPDDV